MVIQNIPGILILSELKTYFAQFHEPKSCYELSYVHDTRGLLQDTGWGTLNCNKVNILGYGDDSAIVAPTAKSLQILINVLYLRPLSSVTPIQCAEIMQNCL